MVRKLYLLCLSILLLAGWETDAQTITTGTITGSPFCAGSAISVPYTKTGTFTAGNVFTAELSNSAGSFASPVTIGTVTSVNSGTISAIIPLNTSGGTGYRIRVISSTPVITGTSNTVDITVVAVAGDTSVYGSGLWNVYCFNAQNFTSYAGYYTENNLSFNTTTRWTSGASPGTANTTSGTAFSGCTMNATNISLMYRRTGFTCGYYQIDIPSHDDAYYLYINGVVVASHVGWGDSHTNAWTGWLGPTSRVDVRLVQGSGGSDLSATFTTVASPPMVLSPPSATVCSGTPVTLTATGMSSYGVSPTTYLSAMGANSAVCTPTADVTYTVIGTDASSGCTTSGTIPITVSASFTTTVTASTTVCPGSSTTLTASGAATYSWSPATGLSATTGFSVTATPTTTTTYTVTGSNNCSTNNASTTLTVPIDTSLYGNGYWNVYCFNTQSYTSYAGYYTENNLSFNTTTRWTSGASPGTANSASGNAYIGCTMNATNISMMFRRTGFTCGYYQIDVPSHDDGYILYIDGVNVASHSGCCDAHTNVWRGYLGPTSRVDFRMAQGTGGSYMAATFTTLASPLVLSSSVTICTTSTTNLTATGLSTYAWSPSTYLSAATGSSVTYTPGVNTTYTCTATDAASGCTATSTVTVTVSNTFTTAVSPTSITVCPGTPTTLTASGAASYSWSPATGLSATTGAVVSATPSVTTTYTVTGSNNCTTNNATSTVSMPIDTSIYGNGVWNVFLFNSTNFTNYQGYYTENNLSFNTTTRWTSGAAPSTANSATGNAYVGCTMPATNWSARFKRTGFTCGMYKIDLNQHDDDFTLLVNGVVVASHASCCDAHSSLWTGVLTTNSTVEFQLKQGTGGSFLQATFTSIAVSAIQRTWNGVTSNDWFTAANWCGGVPDAASDAVIPAVGIVNSPTINGTAACRGLTLNAAIAAGTYTPAVTAPSLTLSGTSTLDVNGNYVSNGSIIPNSGTLVFTGTNTTTITDNIGSALNNVTVNKTLSTALLRLSSNITINGNLTLSGGGLDLNGKIMYVDNSSTSAISRSGTGFIKSEKTSSPYSEIYWRMGTATGTYVFPFALTDAAADYIPVTINKTSAGTGTGRIGIATYPTVAANTPYPTGVTNVFSILVPGNNSANVADRFWITTATGYTALPAADITLTATSTEVGSITSLRAQRWTGSTWEQPVMSPTPQVNPTSYSATVYGVTGFSQWALSGNSMPLPVKLTSFTAACSGNETTLKWSTASEKNSNFFTLERKATAGEFETLGHVQATGNSSTTADYTFRDKQPLNGVSYYRLSQTDRDGTTESFPVISSQCDDDLQLSLNLRPNPVTDQQVTITVTGVDDLSVVSLKICDAFGNVVYAQDNLYSEDGVLIINDELPQLKEGIYIVCGTNGNRFITGKLAVKHGIN